MAQFKDRGEYEKWKAEKIRQAAEKSTPSENTQEEQQPEPDKPEVKYPSPESSENLPDIGELINRTWYIYKERFGTLIALYLVAIAVSFLPLALLSGFGFALGLILPDLKIMLVGVSVAFGIIIFIIILSWGMSGVLCAVVDDSLSFSKALSCGWPRTLGFLWLFSLFGYLISGGFLLFFIPGVIFVVWFGFGQFIFIEQDERGMTALLRSKELVRGHGFDVFIRLFVIWIFSAGVGAIPFIGMIFSFLFFPFTLIYSFLLYQDLKTLKGDISFSVTAGEKFKWIGAATLGYILVPLLILAMFGAALLPSLFLIKGKLSSHGMAISCPGEIQTYKGTFGPSGVVSPSNYKELTGVWSGK